ncbi:hypothetical protein E3O60_00790 [Cryobacterium sp. TMB1-7]|nr:hypothetical protein E3O60_00790 [Cryobacterium sp. TMB1-7]
MPHANPRLTLHGRSLLIERVIIEDSPVSHVAKELGISRQNACGGSTGTSRRHSRSPIPVLPARSRRRCRPTTQTHQCHRLNRRRKKPSIKN